MNSKRVCVIVLGVMTMMGAVAAHAQNERDKAFLQTASQGNYDEIKLSELALQKSSNADVKAFAHRMVTDHTMLGEKMKPFAEKWGIQPADSLDPEHQKEYDKLSGMSGKEFDREYIKCMDADHHQALNAFKGEVQLTKDAQFKPTVRSAEKVIAEHTRLADHLDEKFGMTPAESSTLSEE